MTSSAGTVTASTSAVSTRPVRTQVEEDQRRIEAFCSSAGAEVFHSIVYHQDIWQPDPYDVQTIHAEARQAFERLLNRAATQPPPQSGRVLLLLGESGAGKTHLMRAFRHHVHSSELGYCGYLQMTSLASNYARYVLSNLIDALDQPYLIPNIQESGLTRLAVGVLEAVPGLAPGQREEFRTGHVPDLADRVHRYADGVMADLRFHQIDPDVVRAFLFLARDDTRIRGRALKWLRCEGLAGPDRAVLGDLPPREQEEHPLRMLSSLGRLMWAVHGMPLVLCVDQLEDTFDSEKSAEHFRRAIDTLVSLIDAVPTSVVILSCLEDYYTAQKPHLPRPKRDRVERDPDPVRLDAQRTAAEVRALVARRLQCLYDDQEVEWDERRPTFPFTPEHLRLLAGERTRDVLDFCRKHQQKCERAGQWIEPSFQPTPERVGPPVAPPSDPIIQLEQLWNDFHVEYASPLPEDEDGLAELLHWAAEQCSAELPDGFFFAGELHGRIIRGEAHGPGNAVDRFLAALCERSPRGGGLGHQITEVEQQAGELPIAVVRSTAFPVSPTAQVCRQLKAILQRGGRRVVVENADWRKMLAFRAFRMLNEKRAGFTAWLRESRPLSQLPSLRQVLNLDHWLRRRPGEQPPPEPVKPKHESERPTPPGKATPHALVIGTRLGIVSSRATIDPVELTQHMAFLGGSGSGKTTAALNLIEQLLEQGVPAVLIDRKGDLCRYADPAAWQDALPDPEKMARRQRLRERLDVAVFTPGQPEGRPLTIPIVPEDLSELPTIEREQLAGYAASALGGMMGYKPRGADQSRLAILRKAIELLAALPGVEITVQSLQKLIDERDAGLLTAVGGFEDRHYRKLSEDLLTLWLNQRSLLAGEGEPLRIDALLGLGARARAGKTRLSIISTRFLPDQGTTDFWVAQLLVNLGRWIGKHPAKQLQAVFLFDEADQYLPAVGQPATKAPMENLLRRARSAGVGLFLATQNPGDFDYKCRDTIRTWLVGRVKEQTAINKLRPMWSDSPIDVSAKLPGQKTGEFYLLREKEVCAIHAHPSLIGTEQLSEERIREVARVSMRGAS